MGDWAWQYGCASARLSDRPNGTAMLEVAGLVTNDVILALRRDLNEAVAGALAVVADFRGVVFALRSDQPKPEMPALNLRVIPVAVVALPADMPLCQHQTQNLANRGLVRAVFTDAAEASAWALACGSAMRRDRAWLERRRDSARSGSPAKTAQTPADAGQHHRSDQTAQPAAQLVG